MRKSTKVTVAYLSSFATLALGGCEDNGKWVEAKRCIDQAGIVVEDRHCENNGAVIPRRLPYTYYYGGQGFYPGNRVVGGSHIPQQGISYMRASHLQKGGFGATGRAFVRSGSSAHG